MIGRATVSDGLTIVSGLAAAVLVGAGAALAVRAAMRSSIRRADAIACPPGIEWSGYVKIKGVAQWLLIRGEDARNPLLLFLHGGPGSPETVLAGRRYSAEIEKRFVAVHWEQRGTCKSYSAALARTPLTREQLIGDIDAVSRYLLATYRRSKLYLIGHSWGSWLGIVAISDHPELYHAFIGVGQFVNSIEEERISLHFTLDYLARKGDRAGFAKLAALGEPPYARPFEDIMRQRAVLWRAGGSFGPGYPVTRMIRDALVCPHYGLFDVWRFVKGQIFSAQLSQPGVLGPGARQDPSAVCHPRMLLYRPPRLQHSLRTGRALHQ
jgi:pimeloyl-ACP methyl ester carboxylesterase